MDDERFQVKAEKARIRHETSVRVECPQTGDVSVGVAFTSDVAHELAWRKMCSLLLDRLNELNELRQQNVLLRQSRASLKAELDRVTKMHS